MIWKNDIQITYDLKKNDIEITYDLKKKTFW